ncbi:MAG: Transposase [Acidimicrobiaceae bacterium]|nr:Transposase [Acidimicrobiaceae bacterium]
MVKNQIIVESVVSQGLGVRATATKYGVSPAWVSTLVARYRSEGPSAFEPRSKRPHSNKLATPPATEDRIIELRKELLEFGTDAGADTIHTHLEREGFVAPSISTIQRILTRRGFVTPAPKKRPKSSYVRFCAELPNECWQTDMTHWHLTDGTGVEILTFLDDHSRKALKVRAYPTVTMTNVRRLFRQSCDCFGTPASLLSDNGAIYNAASRGGRSGFESDLIAAGVLYKHSRPYHPQTCGKVERWHRTLKKFLAKHPAATLGELQVVLDEFVRYYNEVRPHRGINRRTPSVAYNARAKAQPNTLIHQPHWRIRTDTVDVRGHVTLRHLGKLRHLNVGWAYRGHSIRLYVLDDVVTFATEDGEFIGETKIDPNRDYQPKGDGFR